MSRTRSAHEELGADIDPVRTVGWFTTKYPVALTVEAPPWSDVLAGAPELGAVLKSAKEQLRSPPIRSPCGLLRYLGDDVDLDRC